MFLIKGLFTESECKAHQNENKLFSARAAPCHCCSNEIAMTLHLIQRLKFDVSADCNQIVTN